MGGSSGSREYRSAAGIKAPSAARVATLNRRASRGGLTPEEMLELRAAANKRRGSTRAKSAKKAAAKPRKRVLSRTASGGAGNVTSNAKRARKRVARRG